MAIYAFDFLPDLLCCKSGDKERATVQVVPDLEQGWMFNDFPNEVKEFIDKQLSAKPMSGGPNKIVFLRPQCCSATDNAAFEKWARDYCAQQKYGDVSFVDKDKALVAYEYNLSGGEKEDVVLLIIDTHIEIIGATIETQNNRPMYTPKESAPPQKLKATAVGRFKSILSDVFDLQGEFTRAIGADLGINGQYYNELDLVRDCSSTTRGAYGLSAYELNSGLSEIEDGIRGSGETIKKSIESAAKFVYGGTFGPADMVCKCCADKFYKDAAGGLNALLDGAILVCAGKVAFDFTLEYDVGLKAYAFEEMSDDLVCRPVYVPLAKMGDSASNYCEVNWSRCLFTADDLTENLTAFLRRKCEGGKSVVQEVPLAVLSSFCNERGKALRGGFKVTLNSMIIVIKSEYDAEMHEFPINLNECRRALTIKLEEKN